MTDYLSNFKVTDRQSFIKFIALLRDDLLKNPDNWENRNLDDFLEAMTRYTEDIQGYFDNTNQNVNANLPSWQTFAEIFKGSTIYE